MKRRSMVFLIIFSLVFISMLGLTGCGKTDTPQQNKAVDQATSTAPVGDSTVESRPAEADGTKKAEPEENGEQVEENTAVEEQPELEPLEEHPAEVGENIEENTEENSRQDDGQAAEASGGPAEDGNVPEGQKEQDFQKDKTDVEEVVKEDPNAVKTEGETVLFVDDFGKKQVIHKKPKNVVCLYNSFADLWYSLGGDIVGRIDSTSSLPTAYLDKEIVGSMGGVNVEKLLTLKPDLVIIASNIDGQTRIIPILQQNKIEYIALQYESIEEYFKTLKLFGNILGSASEADGIIAKVKKDVNGVIAKATKDRHPSVLLLFGSTRSVTVKTQYSTVGSMLEDLGARNIAYDPRLSAEQMEAFSMERVLQEDPDYIFVQTMGDDVNQILNRVKKDVESNPAWASLTAVKEGRYIVLPKDLYLYKPNKRYGEAYLGLARILYPDAVR